LLALFRGELDEADRFVAMLLDHSSRYHLDFWVVWAECFQAVLALRRDEKDSLARLRSTLTRSLVPIAQPRFAALRIHLVESLGAAGEREGGRGIVAPMRWMGRG